MSAGKQRNENEQARKARLADALRDNLKRRKTQARQRQSGDSAVSLPSPQSGHGGVIGHLGNPDNES